MPIFEYKCMDCGQHFELITTAASSLPSCSYCNSSNLEKQMSVHSSSSGPSRNRMPGPGDTACCGSSPGQASGCQGPGSCCGRSFE